MKRKEKEETKDEGKRRKKERQSSFSHLPHFVPGARHVHGPVVVDRDDRRLGVHAHHESARCHRQTFFHEQVGGVVLGDGAAAAVDVGVFFQEGPHARDGVLIEGQFQALRRDHLFVRDHPVERPRRLVPCVSDPRGQLPGTGPPRARRRGLGSLGSEKVELAHLDRVLPRCRRDGVHHVLDQQRRLQGPGGPHDGARREVGFGELGREPGRRNREVLVDRRQHEKRDCFFFFFEKVFCFWSRQRRDGSESFRYLRFSSRARALPLSLSLSLSLSLYLHHLFTH